MHLGAGNPHHIGFCLHGSVPGAGQPRQQNSQQICCLYRQQICWLSLRTVDLLSVQSTDLFWILGVQGPGFSSSPLRILGVLGPSGRSAKTQDLLDRSPPGSCGSKSILWGTKPPGSKVMDLVSVVRLYSAARIALSRRNIALDSEG